MKQMDEIVLVLTNLPDRESALRVASALIESRAAACVNILAECTSVYYWRGKTETASEVPLLIKATCNTYRDIEKIIHALHPYELPEIMAVSVRDGFPDYLNWIVQATSVAKL